MLQHIKKHTLIYNQYQYDVAFTRQSSQVSWDLLYIGKHRIIRYIYTANKYSRSITLALENFYWYTFFSSHSILKQHIWWIKSQKENTSTKQFLFCNWSPPSWCFSPLDLRLEYWIEHITIGRLYINFIFSTRIFYSAGAAFAADCSRGVWCRWLTTCLLYVIPLFGSLFWNHSCSVTSKQWKMLFYWFRVCYWVYIFILTPKIVVYSHTFFPYTSTSVTGIIQRTHISTQL